MTMTPMRPSSPMTGLPADGFISKLPPTFVNCLFDAPCTADAPPRPIISASDVASVKRRESEVIFDSCVGCCDVRVAGNGPASSNNYPVRIERQANEHGNGAVPVLADVDRARHGAVGHKTSLDVQLNRGSFRRQTKKGVAMRQFFLLI
jgi:hypothetical protein